MPYSPEMMYTFMSHKECETTQMISLYTFFRIYADLYKKNKKHFIVKALIKSYMSALICYVALISGFLCCREQNMSTEP